jgi:RNA polymerase primary sigma factor
LLLSIPNLIKMKRLVIAQNVTWHEYESLDKYFNEINKIMLLSPEEEAVLAAKIREGDQSSLERLTKANLRFVVSVAKQYQQQGLTLGDLINEGNCGLIMAAKRYDETKGFKFISYAVWWIRQSIIMAIAEHSRLVRLPYGQLTLLRKINKAIAKLEQCYGRTASVEEVSDSIGIGTDKVAELLSKSSRDISIDEPLGQNKEMTLLQVFKNEDEAADHWVINDAVREEIKYSLKVLGNRERELIILYFGLGTFFPLSLEEIGKKFSITITHARRLKDKALTELRNSPNAAVLMSCIS